MSLATTALSGAFSSSVSLSGSPWQALLDQLVALWHSDKRLYTLKAVSPERPLPADLMVESFVLQEALSQPFSLHIQALTLNAHVELKQLYARPITLVTVLADGSTCQRSGYVTEAQALEADGGLARKSLLVQPWVALLGHTLNSRVWQDLSVIDIVEDVFADHDTIAAWRWDDDVPSYVAQGQFARNEGQRSYCVQYRESDLDFVQRLLAEEGLGWRVEEDATAPGGHTMVIFASSQAQPQDPTSATSLGGAGIRFHRSSSQEQQDSIQSLGAWRQLGSMGTTVLGWDYQANRAITADVPTNHQWGGEQASNLQSWLTSYDPTGDYIFGNQAEAQFAATRLQEAREVRFKTWLGSGTVRTLRPGTWAAITQSTLDSLTSLGAANENKQFFFTRVVAMGINNLPKELSGAITSKLGAGPLLDLVPNGVDTQTMQKQATQTGFANQFEAIRRDVAWRPVLLDDTGMRPRPRPTALGPQTAIVVGPCTNGGAQPYASGADEIHTDRLGRVKVQFHWQANSYNQGRATADHSCWLRVMQRSAGAGAGHQHIPRIGQEVLVGFLSNDIDRPFVWASLYNGQGEGGVPATPGGQDAQADTSGFANSTDHRPSAQMNLIGSGVGGNSPAWHGAAPGSAAESQEGQNNAAALSGIKSKELGGNGYNQLVFDDTPNQLRTQLHSTQSQTWLQMGHLLHQADNHRGSFRGQGFELRTDAWGGLRAAKGIMLTTFGLNGMSSGGQGQTADPAGDNAPGMALAKQAQQLASTFNQAAATHQTVALAAAVGSGKAGTSALSDEQAAAQALTQSLGATIEQNGSSLPHMADPNVVIVGKAGVGLTAGQDLILSSNDVIQLASGQDSQLAVGGKARIQTGQAIGILAGAIQAGNEAAGKGLSIIAAQGPIDLQAQAGPAQIASKGALEIKSANGEINIASSKKITLAVAGGASITIEGGSFTAQAPGKILVQAGKKSMVGPDQVNYSYPDLPSEKMYAATYVVKDDQDRPVKGQRYLLTMPNGETRLGETNSQGQTVTAFSNSPQPVELTLVDGDEWHQTEINSAHQEMDKYWSRGE